MSRLATTGVQTAQLAKMKYFSKISYSLSCLLVSEIEIVLFIRAKFLKGSLAEQFASFSIS